MEIEAGINSARFVISLKNILLFSSPPTFYRSINVYSHTCIYPYFESYKTFVNIHKVPGTKPDIEYTVMTKAVSHLALHMRRLLK